MKTYVLVSGLCINNAQQQDANGTLLRALTCQYLCNFACFQVRGNRVVPENAAKSNTCFNPRENKLYVSKRINPLTVDIIENAVDK